MAKTKKNECIPAAENGDGIFRDIRNLLKQSDSTLGNLFSYQNPAKIIENISSEFDSLPIVETVGFGVPLRNGDIICVGRNYAAHAKELNNPVPKEPVLFMKPGTCLLENGGDIILHKDCVSVEYEGELALIIGNDVFGNISIEEAKNAIVGVTLLNDVTDRGKQNELKAAGKPWVAAKGRPTFAPCGPGIYMLNTYDELLEMGIETRINNETRQRGTVAEWLWNPAQLISSIAKTTGLHAGSIVATGTPSGVGKLTEGSTVEIHSPLIGTLKNQVKSGN